MSLSFEKFSKTAHHPFRKVALTSIISGALMVVFAIILLLMVKPDLQSRNLLLAYEKIAVSLSFLYGGFRLLSKGYFKEYKFDVRDVYDIHHDRTVGRLLWQRLPSGLDNGQKEKQLGALYARFLHSRSFSLQKGTEMHELSNQQKLFYEAISPKGFTKKFDFLPHPISRFIGRQSSPVMTIAYFIGGILLALFISYLGFLPFTVPFYWVGLLSLLFILNTWIPIRISVLFELSRNGNARFQLQSPQLFLIIIFIFLFLKPPGTGATAFVFFAFFLLTGGIIYSSLLAFNLIRSVFNDRDIVTIKPSSYPPTTLKVGTQPNNILQQFDNVIKASTGWYGRYDSGDVRDALRGEQNKKGDFSLEYVYETIPRLITYRNDPGAEKHLNLAWLSGTILICLGILVFSLGIGLAPGITFNGDLLTTPTDGRLLASFFSVIIGISLFFIGSRLVYEIYYFFHTELFFESEMILFQAKGSFDEYEKVSSDASTKHKDTSTDFTPDILVTKIVSSVFVFSGLRRDELYRQPRYLVKTEKDDDLHEKIVGQFMRNLSPYLTRSSDTQLLNP